MPSVFSVCSDFRAFTQLLFKRSEILPISDLIFLLNVSLTLNRHLQSKIQNILELITCAALIVLDAFRYILLRGNLPGLKCMVLIQLEVNACQIVITYKVILKIRTASHCNIKMVAIIVFKIEY